MSHTIPYHTIGYTAEQIKAIELDIDQWADKIIDSSTRATRYTPPILSLDPASLFPIHGE